MRHLPQLRHLVLPFVTTKTTSRIYSISPHALGSLKFSLRGLRECDFLAALLPALANLKSLVLGILPAGYDTSDSLDDDDGDNFISRFDPKVVRRLAKTLQQHGSNLRTFGFLPAIPFGTWYEGGSSMRPQLFLLGNALPATVHHILLSPPGHPLSDYLSCLPDRFSGLRQLTITSETRSDIDDFAAVLDKSDLSALAELCEKMPSLDLITFKNVRQYSPRYGENNLYDRERAWDNMKRAAMAAGTRIEQVDRNGYESVRFHARSCDEMDC